jgi:hypothetical protein
MRYNFPRGGKNNVNVGESVSDTFGFRGKGWTTGRVAHRITHCHHQPIHNATQREEAAIEKWTNQRWVEVLTQATAEKRTLGCVDARSIAYRLVQASFLRLYPPPLLCYHKTDTVCLETSGSQR